jgi:hypothetical protein
MEFEKGEVVEWLIDDHQRIKKQRVGGIIEKKTKEQEKASLISVLDKLLSKSAAAFPHSKTTEQSGDLPMAI